MVNNRFEHFLLINQMVFVLSVCFGQVIVPYGYNKAFRPNGEGGEPLEIEFSIKVNVIQDIDYNKMTVKMLMYLCVSWIDDRLLYPDKFLTRLYKNVDSVSLQTVFLDRIWTPDHYFWLMHDIKEFKLLQTFLGVKLFRNKRILTSSMTSVEFSCPMNFRNYPFDVQFCEILLGSYFYNVQEVNFKWHKLGLIVDNEVEKQLANYEFSFIKFNETLCPCPSCYPENIPCIKIVLKLERHYLVYLLGYFIPSTLFIIVAWTSFFWPADVIPGRTVLVITSLLTVSSMYSASRDDGPKTSYVKALDAWMLFAIFSTVLSLFQYAVVLQWKKRREAIKPEVIHPIVSNYIKRSHIKRRSTAERDSSIMKYQIYERRTELAGRIGLPILYLLFNLVYWPWFF